MRTSLSFAVLAAAALSSAPGAGEIPSPITPVAPASSMTRSVGLQIDPASGGLQGGGHDYRVRFGANGMRFEPALGRAVQRTQSLALGLDSIARGGEALLSAPASAAPRAQGSTAVFDRAGGIQERYELRPEGVELSFLFPEPLAGTGDLVVRMALETTLPLPGAARADGGLAFELPGQGGVSIGAVAGIDAAGRSTAGSLRLAAGALELVLPAAFVDSASYPLILDPLVGSAFDVSPTTPVDYDDARPDAAYDASTDRYLVVWERTFSASDSDIRGQRITSAGALSGGTIFFGSAGLSTNPCVCNLNTPGTFLVAWEQSVIGLPGTTHSIQVQAVASATGALGSALSAVAYLNDTVTDPDLGGDGVKNVGFDSKAILVYDDGSLGAIRGRRLWVDTAGVLHMGTSFTIASDNPGVFLFNARPSIARSAGVYHRLVVVYERLGLLALTNGTIRAQLLDLDGVLYGSSILIASDSAASMQNPDIDGFDRLWVAAWEKVPDSGSTNVQACSLAFGTSVSDIAAAPAIDVTTIAAFGNAARPAVGFSGGKSWLAWRQTSTLLFNSTQRIRGYDSKSCVTCEGPLTLSTGGMDANEWIAIATPTSGGAYYDDRGLAVWSEMGANGDVQGQLLVNSALGGSAQNLGGGCGTGGTMTLSPGPAIGTSWFIFGVVGLPPGTSLAFINLSSPSVPITCGACAWNPFQLAAGYGVVGGASSSAAVIPCNPSLVGAQFEAQWTSVTPAAAPCSLFPGVSLSDRWRLTVGQ